MKILNIMLGRNMGGIEQAFLDYSCALNSNKVQVINITSSFAKINKFTKKQKQRYITVPNLGIWDMFSVIYIKIIIKFLKPDFIIAHGRRAISLTKFSPLIGVAHNYQIKGLVKCDYIIALTQHMRSYLLSQRIDREKIILIPNMIKIDNDYKKSTFNELITIGVCGRFVRKKGLDIFLQSVKLLKDQNYNFKALIGGDGKEKEALLAMTKFLQLEDKVKFVGWVHDKSAFFNQIDIFCLPSLHEPFGIILLEAMQYSKPIIATKSEGPLEIIQDMKTGILTEIGDAEDLAKKLIFYINNQSQAQAFAADAYLELQNKYNRDIVAQKIINFLENISN